MLNKNNKTIQHTHFAVLGDPIKHSLSPALHNWAFKKQKIQANYTRNQVPKGQLQQFVKNLDTSWLGLSITMPLKEEALKLADTSSENASATGAANTLLRKNRDTWHAENTDVTGFQAAFKRLKLDTTQIIVLGAGATALSLARAAWHQTAKTVTFYSRKHCPQLLSRATSWNKIRSPDGKTTSTLYTREPLTNLPKLEPHAATLIVSTLPATAHTQLQLPENPGNTPIFDISYAPTPSILHARLRETGWRGKAYNGTELLIEQALDQAALFAATTGATPADRSKLHAGMLNLVQK